MIRALFLSIFLIIVGFLALPYILGIWAPFSQSFLNSQTVDPLVAIFMVSFPTLLFIAYALSAVFNPQV